jgi:hypothetical protein
VKEEGDALILASAHLEWDGGGFALFVSAGLNAVALVSTVPWPPGSRISGTLVAEPRASVRIKVHRSRAEADGTFRLDGRPLDLTRELRARIEAMAERP